MALASSKKGKSYSISPALRPDHDPTLNYTAKVTVLYPVSPSAPRLLVVAAAVVAVHTWFCEFSKSSDF